LDTVLAPVEQTGICYDLEMSESRRSAWQDKAFKDKNGRTTLWQSPNLALLTWAIAVVASKIITGGKPHQILVLVAFGAIFTWAWLEIFSGVNYFRRAVGLIVLILSIHARLS